MFTFLIVKIATFDLILVMCETANQTKNFAELAGRTQPVVGDVVMAMVNMGMSFKDLDVSWRILLVSALSSLICNSNYQKYALREGRPTARSLNPSKAPNPIQILQAGSKPSNPVHIPIYLPSLPDPHAYVRTATYKQPETEYEAIREKSANQKRDVEKALTKFLAKTSKKEAMLVTKNLFNFSPFQAPTLTAYSITKRTKYSHVSWRWLPRTRSNCSNYSNSSDCVQTFVSLLSERSEPVRPNFRLGGTRILLPRWDSMNWVLRLWSTFI